MGDRSTRYHNALALPQGSASTSLRRESSQSSSRSGGVPSPRRHDSHRIMPELSIDSSATSSASGSRSGSHISTPRLLSRRNSSKEPHNAKSYIARKLSSKTKGKAKEEPPVEVPETVTPDSIKCEQVTMEVVETPLVNIERDPGTGRKMINQYLVLQEIGHGTHGRVRLGRDMSVENSGEADLSGDMGSGNAYYAIKIVDRNPRSKRLMGFSRNKARNEGAKLVNENEIRKEIAIFKKVNHPNVVRMKEIIDDPESSKLFMVLEYCAGGELQWKDKDARPTLSLDSTRRVFRDTLLGLEYLHHQGIIHRDIKPSNLLFSNDGTVKISDFGCSHYSEALQEASARAGPDGEGYVDDIELAKTAGSPAFFAPEMCFTGFEPDVSSLSSRSPRDTPVQEIPAFTLRPPSIASEFGDPRGNLPEVYTISPGGRTFPLKPTVSNDSGLSRRPFSDRTQSTTTIGRQPRHPITNAIDVWALGVTLYCLLFGKTPFDAQNEYQLMQVIPTADYDVPPHIASERLPTFNGPLEVQDCLDLLRRLLTKDPQKRISLEQAKRHPFTLEGLADPTSWLARTGPHAQSFVTVSNAEVAAVVVKSVSVRDKFRKGIKSFSQKLQILSGTRHRSRSVGEDDTDSRPTTAILSGPTSSADSQSILSPQGLHPAKLKSFSRDASPLASPAPGYSFTRKFSFAQSPRRSSVQLGSPPVDAMAPEMSSRSVSSQSAQRGFVVHRPAPMTVQPESIIPLSIASQSRPSPRTMTSSSSLDRLRTSLDGVSGTNLPRRSSDVEIPGRQRERAPSIASSSGGLGGRLRSILSRSGSSRSRPPPATSDVDEVHSGASRVLSSSAISVSESAGRQSSDMESISTGPHGSAGGFDRPWNPRRDDGRLRRGSNLSEELAHRMMDVNSRRGSHLSEVFHRGAVDSAPGFEEEEVVEEVEEVDWIGSTSSGDDVSDGGREEDAYDAGVPNIQSFASHNLVASATPSLASIPDRSPSGDSPSTPTQPGASPVTLQRLAIASPPSSESLIAPEGDDQSRRREPGPSHAVDDEALAINLSRRGRKGSLMVHRK